MTDHPTPSSATSDTASEDLVTQACVHIDAAVRQVEAAADADVFSPLLSLAGLLSLIRGGLDPSIRAAHDPNDPLLPMDHVDRALSLLDSVHPRPGKPTCGCGACACRTSGTPSWPPSWHNGEHHYGR